MTFLLDAGNLVLLDLGPCLFCPSLERNLEIHDCQEWIDTILFLYKSVLDVIIGEL